MLILAFFYNFALKYQVKRKDNELDNSHNCWLV